MHLRKVVRVSVLMGLAVILVTLPSAVPAPADSGSASFNYLVASGFLCGLDPSACPAIAVASNGDTIEITGAGTLSIHTKTVMGSGAFTHKSSDGTVLGTGVWTATELESFRSYGTAPDFPPNFEGGLAVVRVHLVPDSGAPANAILQVNCAIGKAPKGHSGDFVRLAVEGGGPNFNKGVSGFTLFIRLP